MSGQLSLVEAQPLDPFEVWSWTNEQLFTAARRRTVPAEVFFEAANALESQNPIGRQATIVVLRQAGRRARGRRFVWHDVHG